MSGFTKLFGSMLASSIWCEDNETRLVWVTMLALANRDGLVEAAVPGLAHAARVPVDSCRRAIEKFLAPDPDSRSMNDEGRRIERVPGGWRLINYKAYRKKLSAEDRRDYQAAKQAEYRARKPRASRKKQKYGPITGEAAYEQASANGASQEDLDDIVTSNFPEVMR